MSVEAMAWAKRQEAGTPGAKLVLLVLADYADEEGVSWPSKRTLAQVSEQSPRTVQRHLQNLIQEGLLAIQVRLRENGSQTSSIYCLPLDGGRCDLVGGSQNVLGGESWCPGGGDKLTEGGGDKLTPPEEPSVRTTKEPPEETDAHDQEASPWEEQMHQQLCHEFHHPQWRLTANRRSRYRAMIKEWGDRPDFLILWGILLRAIWSDPWRREARSHHDPTNILRSFEQREGWWEVAEAELEAGRDGGTYHQLTHAPRPSEQAAIERQREASLSRARTKVAKLESELDAQAQDDNQQMAAWWKARSLAEQRELMAKAGEMMRELWPFDTKPTEGINRAVYMKLWREAQERQPADLQLTP